MVLSNHFLKIRVVLIEASLLEQILDERFVLQRLFFHLCVVYLGQGLVCY